MTGSLISISLEEGRIRKHFNKTGTIFQEAESLGIKKRLSGTADPDPETLKKGAGTNQ